MAEYLVKDFFPATSTFITSHFPTLWKVAFPPSLKAIDVVPDLRIHVSEHYVSAFSCPGSVVAIRNVRKRDICDCLGLYSLGRLSCDVRNKIVLEEKRKSETCNFRKPTAAP